MDTEIARATTQIASAYLRRSYTDVAKVPAIITDVARALQSARDGIPEPECPEGLPKPSKPAVPIARSIQPDFLICLEDGAKLKMLKRYLRSHFGLSPEEYRRRWKLPADYPMIAPDHSAARSLAAKAGGLGRKVGDGRAR